MLFNLFGQINRASSENAILADVMKSVHFLSKRVGILPEELAEVLTEPDSELDDYELKFIEALSTKLFTLAENRDQLEIASNFRKKVKDLQSDES